MIKKETLSNIFKTEIIDYYGNEEDINFIFIEKKKFMIYILSDKNFLKTKNYLNTCIERKNCWIEKSNDPFSKTYIIFHQDYIHSIIRQKLLNTLLND